MSVRSDEIGTVLLQLSAYFGADVFTARDNTGNVRGDCTFRLNCYLDELSSLTPEQFHAAVSRIKKGWKPTSANPFPAIYEFLSAVGEAPDDGGLTALAEVKKAVGPVGRNRSVSFCDPALHYAITAYGGWESICNWGQKDWSLNERKMLDTYNEARRMNRDGGNHLAGRDEKSYGYSQLKVRNLKTGKTEYEFEFRGQLGDHTVKMLNLLCYGEPDKATQSIADKSGGMAQFPVQGLINQICKLSA